MKAAKGVVAVAVMMMMASLSGARFGEGAWLYSVVDLAAAGWWASVAYSNLKGGV